MTCTCATKSFLHTAECASVQQKIRGSLYILAEEAFKHPDGVFFYVAATDTAALAMAGRFRKSLKSEDFMYSVEVGSICTFTMANGAEVTFLPENEALNLRELPNSTRIFFETTNATRDLSEVLTSHTGAVCVVDTSTKELM